VTITFEESASLIARLLKTWALEHDVDLRGQAGADERYTLGPLADGVLDIVIAVGEPELATYARLGTREVWQWSPTDQRIVVRELHEGRYRERQDSAVLPDLELARLASFVRLGESHTRLARAYRETFLPGSKPPADARYAVCLERRTGETSMDPRSQS
jgi:hypothetical protein